MLKSAYRFFFVDHIVGLVRFMFAVTILCAFSTTLCKIWFVVVWVIYVLVILAERAGWNRMNGD